TIVLPGIITIPSPTFTQANSAPSISNADFSSSIPVNSSGRFTAPLGTDVLNLVSTTLSVSGNAVELTLATDTGFSTPLSEGWSDGIFVAQIANGSGSWALPNTPPGGVPEPSTITLLGAGVVSLAGYAWRKRRPAVPLG